MRSPSAIDRAAASSRSAPVRQPRRRRIAYVSMWPPPVVCMDSTTVSPRVCGVIGRNAQVGAPGLPVFEEAEALCSGHGLAARAGVELAEHGRHVMVAGPAREEELLGDLGVAL